METGEKKLFKGNKKTKKKKMRKQGKHIADKQTNKANITCSNFFLDVVETLDKKQKQQIKNKTKMFGQKIFQYQ